MFKRQLRSIARRTRDWLTEDPTGWEDEPTATGWLNAQHKTLLAKGDGDHRAKLCMGHPAWSLPGGRARNTTGLGTRVRCCGRKRPRFVGEDRGGR